MRVCLLVCPLLNSCWLCCHLPILAGRASARPALIARAVACSFAADSVGGCAPHPCLLSWRILRRAFRGADFAARISRRGIRGADFAARISRRGFRGAGFAARIPRHGLVSCGAPARGAQKIVCHFFCFHRRRPPTPHRPPPPSRRACGAAGLVSCGAPARGAQKIVWTLGENGIRRRKAPPNSVPA